jgi:predicted component of type VI protein secretion system
MLRLPSLAVVGLALTLVGCSSAQKASKPASVVTGPIQINLDLKGGLWQERCDLRR